MTVPTLTDLLFIKRGFLSKEQCEIIINEFKSNHHKQHLEKYRDASTAKRKESTYTVVHSQIGSKSFNLIHSTVEKIINQYHDYLDSFDAFNKARRATLMHPHVYRILKYEKGASIQPHSDHDMGVYGSCTINLNDEYTGGDFCFWNGKHRLKLGQGDVIIFPADHFWVHEVKQITSGVRYSTNTFLCKMPRHLPEDVKFKIDNLNQDFAQSRLSRNLIAQDQDTAKSFKSHITYG